MADERPDERQMPRKFNFLRVPLFRLLAINLAAGVSLATLLVGGLLVLNPGGLRDLILADRTPGTALGLLLFGFVVTFGSAVMGTAIMAMGKPQADQEGPRDPQSWWRKGWAGMTRGSRLRTDADLERLIEGGAPAPTYGSILH